MWSSHPSPCLPTPGDGQGHFWTSFISQRALEVEFKLLYNFEIYPFIFRLSEPFWLKRNDIHWNVSIVEEWSFKISTKCNGVICLLIVSRTEFLWLCNCFPIFSLLNKHLDRIIIPCGKDWVPYCYLLTMCFRFQAQQHCLPWSRTFILM